jgi:hypothetical protein
MELVVWRFPGIGWHDVRSSEDSGDYPRERNLYNKKEKIIKS